MSQVGVSLESVVTLAPMTNVGSGLIVNHMPAMITEEYSMQWQKPSRKAQLTVSACLSAIAMAVQKITASYDGCTAHKGRLSAVTVMSVSSRNVCCDAC